MSKPTKFTPGNKGDIYTDAETGIKYECLGRLGFCDTSFRDEPVEYNWVEAHASKYGGGDSNLLVIDFKRTGDRIYACTTAVSDLVQAIDDGKFIVARKLGYNGTCTGYALCETYQYDYDLEDYYVSFYAQSGIGNYESYTLYPSGEVQEVVYG